MRENIGLFKAKHRITKNWVYGSLILQDNKEPRIIGRYDKAVANSIIPETICECTGLKDKNGKLIFENDLVRFRVQIRFRVQKGTLCEPENFNKLEETKEIISFVRYDIFLASYVLQSLNGGYFEFRSVGNFRKNDCPLNIEVIGNKFEEVD